MLPLSNEFQIQCACVHACHMVDVGTTVQFCHACNNHVWYMEFTVQ